MMMSEIEDLMLIEVTQSKQQRQSSCQSFNLENFGLNFQHMTALKQAVSAAPDFDKTLVEKIKQELSAGSYTISSLNVAEKMLFLNV
jgi:flagellar biosynthesis anti-sigma factor FlgM